MNFLLQKIIRPNAATQPSFAASSGRLYYFSLKHWEILKKHDSVDLRTKFYTICWKGTIAKKQAAANLTQEA